MLRKIPPVRISICTALVLLAFLGAVADATSQSTAADTLRAPTTLANISSAPGTVEVNLTAEPTDLQLLPGATTAVYAYNGTVPGPTLELREGDRVTVNFRNNLPEQTTVHWHGFQLPIDADGSPLHPVGPGEEYRYEFTVPAGVSGTYWYHPHPHHDTAFQVGMGLYGAVIVRAADDPLPGTLREQLLVLSDNRFLSDGSLDFPDPDSPGGRVDEVNGREGRTIFVNDQLLPTIPIRSGEVQRWRVVNASASRVYRLSLSGHTFLHVGSDGGLFETPVEKDEILVANSERVELLVRGTGAPGTRTTMRTLPYDRYMAQTRPADWDEPLEILTLQYTDDPPTPPIAIPETLRTVPALEPVDATATRVVLMSQGRLNGKVMDMGRVDISAPLGATEIWEVENLVGMDHPFHLHGFRFQVLDRNGVPEPSRSWKDSVNVPKRETVRFIVRYDEHPGKWMFHCHILEHEDQGMMGILEIR